MDDRTIIEWASEIAKAETDYYSGKDYSDSNGQQRYFECFVNDGIVCDEKWKTEGNPRILVILRETREQYDPFCKRPDIGDNIYDLTKYLKKSNDKYTFEWNMPHSTYRPLAKWIKEIFVKFEYKIPGNDNIFEHVAVINLKKTPGGAHCDKKKLNMFCKKFYGRLREQIKYIDSNIIILANEYDNFFDTIMNDDINYIKTKEKNYFRSSRKKPSPLGLHICKPIYRETSLLVFNAYHPCSNRTAVEDFQDVLCQYDCKK